jgi:hypothetical protein
VSKLFYLLYLNGLLDYKPLLVLFLTMIQSITKKIEFGGLIMATAYKISDLIIILTEKQEVYGDLDVVYEDDYMNYRLAIRVDVDEEIIPVLVIG